MTRARTTSLSFAVALALVGCGKKKEAPAPAPAKPVAPPAPTVDAATPSSNTITVSVDEHPEVGTAVRCSLDGDPLNGDYMKGNLWLAAGPADELYVSDGSGVRRYRRDAGDGCKLLLDRRFGTNGVLGLPKVETPAQRLDGGPVYMRSGGPDWHLVTDPKGATYMYDLFGGVYRVDHGKAEPVCPGFLGLHALVFADGKAYAQRDGLQAIALAKGCKAAPVAGAPTPRGGVFGVAGQLWLATDSETLFAAPGGKVGEEPTIHSEDAFKPGGFCALSAMVACGGHVCVTDANCHKVEIFDADGTFRAELGKGLFATTPFGMPSAAGAADGALYLGVTHHDGDVREGAVYWVPASELE